MDFTRQRLSGSRTVAFVTPQYFDDDSYIGGGERYPLNLAQGVVAATGGATRIEIFSFGPSARALEIGPGVTLHVLPVAYQPRNPLNPISWNLAAALADVDVVHVHQMLTRPGEASILISSLLGKPVFATDLGGHASTIGLRCEMLDLTTGLICISDFSASMLQTRSPVTVVRGGVDTTRFTPAMSEPDRGHVLYVGRLLPHKGIDNLLKALPTGLPLVIAGTPYDDVYLAHLRKMAAGKEVEFRTRATDDELLQLYRTAIATVLPSVYRDYAGNFYRAPELMGLTLLESMACGTPAVCSRVGGMPEFLKHGETGFIFDSVDDLRDILSGLSNGRLPAREIGAAARRAAVEQFDIRRVGAQVAELYDEALGDS